MSAITPPVRTTAIVALPSLSRAQLELAVADDLHVRDRGPGRGDEGPGVRVVHRADFAELAELGPSQQPEVPLRRGGADPATPDLSAGPVPRSHRLDHA